MVRVAGSVREGGGNTIMIAGLGFLPGSLKVEWSDLRQQTKKHLPLQELMAASAKEN